MLPQQSIQQSYFLVHLCNTQSLLLDDPETRGAVRLALLQQAFDLLKLPRTNRLQRAILLGCLPYQSLRLRLITGRFVKFHVTIFGITASPEEISEHLLNEVDWQLLDARCVSKAAIPVATKAGHLPDSDPGLSARQEAGPSRATKDRSDGHAEPCSQVHGPCVVSEIASAPFQETAEQIQVTA